MTDIEIRNAAVLPANREEIEFLTADGKLLVGELATPISGAEVATLVCLHPLPTHGGFMDSHVMKKAANRLPALAQVAVLRFNTRGTTSERGTSSGQFDEGIAERFDVEAAVKFAQERGLKNIWLLGWSFGTELAMKYGSELAIEGAILLSPPLHRTSDAELARWNSVSKKLVAIIPEFDDYLKPDQARDRFRVVPVLKQIDVEGAKHLWVGEDSVTRVLNEIVRVVAPKSYPLPTVFRA